MDPAGNGEVGGDAKMENFVQKRFSVQNTVAARTRRNNHKIPSLTLSIRVSLPSVPDQKIWIPDFHFKTLNILKRKMEEKCITRYMQQKHKYEAVCINECDATLCHVTLL